MLKPAFTKQFERDLKRIKTLANFVPLSGIRIILVLINTPKSRGFGRGATIAVFLNLFQDLVFKIRFCAYKVDHNVIRKIYELIGISNLKVIQSIIT